MFSFDDVIMTIDLPLAVIRTYQGQDKVGANFAEDIFAFYFLCEILCAGRALECELNTGTS